MVLIRLLGGLELLSSAGEPIHSATRKTLLFLAALALLGEKGARRGPSPSFSLGPIVRSPRPGAAFGKPSLRSGVSQPRLATARCASTAMRKAWLLVDSSKVDVQLFERLIRSGIQTIF